MNIGSVNTNGYNSHPIKSNQVVEVVMANGTAVFFSYMVPVAAFIPGRGYVRTSRRWSVATTMHINAWLADKRAEEVEEVDQDVISNLSYGL